MESGIGLGKIRKRETRPDMGEEAGERGIKK